MHFFVLFHSYGTLRHSNPSDRFVLCCVAGLFCETEQWWFFTSYTERGLVSPHTPCNDISFLLPTGSQNMSSTAPPIAEHNTICDFVSVVFHSTSIQIMDCIAFQSSMFSIAHDDCCIFFDNTSIVYFYLFHRGKFFDGSQELFCHLPQLPRFQ